MRMFKTRCQILPTDIQLYGQIYAWLIESKNRFTSVYWYKYTPNNTSSDSPCPVIPFKLSVSSRKPFKHGRGWNPCHS